MTETETLRFDEWLAALPDGVRVERNIDHTLEAWQWDARHSSAQQVGWWESPTRWHLLHPAWVALADGHDDIHAAR